MIDKLEGMLGLNRRQIHPLNSKEERERENCSLRQGRVSKISSKHK